MNPIALERFTQFIRDNHARWATDPQQQLAAYLLWHWRRGLLAASMIGDDTFAICTVRFLAQLEDWLRPWAWHPEGQICLIDLMVAASPLAMADCFEQLVGRWGPRPIILWERGPRTEKPGCPPRIYRWDQFMKLARRVTYDNLPKQLERRLI